jgi:hypothetical protein
MKRRALTEQVSAVDLRSNDIRVDRDAGVIHNVRILGRVSKNRYDPGTDSTEYTVACMEQARPLYEGAKVNIDHKMKPNERSAIDGFGKLQNVRYLNDSLIGDLHYLKSHRLAESVVEDVERKLGVYGLSHHAVAGAETIDRKGRRLVIESIASVKSVDLVQDPATNRTLWESTMPTTATPFRTLLESLTKKHTPAQRQAVRTLLEMDGMGDMPVMAEPASEDPDAALMNGFRAAINALIDQYEEAEIDAATAGDKIVKLLATHEELVADAGPETEPEKETTGGTETQESVQAQLAELAVRRLCESVQYTPKPAVLRALIALPDDASRRQLIESVNVPAPAPTGQPPLRKPRSGMPGSVGKTTPDAGTALSVLRS